MLIDSTGIGDPICDELYRENVRIDGYKFTNATKKDLIENLSIMIENQQLTIPYIPELINELKLYGYKTTASGNVQYGAPEGYHDELRCRFSVGCLATKTDPASKHRCFLHPTLKYTPNPNFSFFGLVWLPLVFVKFFHVARETLFQILAKFCCQQQRNHYT